MIELSTVIQFSFLKSAAKADLCVQGVRTILPCHYTR